MIGHIFPDPKAHALALSWWGATGSTGFVYVVPLRTTSATQHELTPIQTGAYHRWPVYIPGLLAVGMYHASLIRHEDFFTLICVLRYSGSPLSSKAS